jgi:dihydrodipicolinate synthase/N-acetylneuraminate lyase
MTGTAIRGVMPVLSTPFDRADRIDADVLASEVEWLIGWGVDGLTLAMVSEVLRLSEAERRELLGLVLASVAGRVPVVASVGAESTRATVALARHACESGATALMAIPPATVELPDRAIEAYFRAVLDSVDAPLVVQDASGYLGRPLSLELYVGLLDAYGPDRVLFKPEAVPIGPRLTALREATGGRARVFEGTGGIALVDSHRRGIVGTMPGPEVPWALVPLWQALESGDTAKAAAIHAPLAALVSLQTSLDSFVAVEKYLLVRQGVFTDPRRREPCGDALDPETTLEVDRLVDLLHAVVVPPSKPVR